VKVTGIITLVCLSLAACAGADNSALGVCNKLQANGIAANCRAEKPSGLGIAAVEKVSFELPSVPGKTGQVLKFNKAIDYESTVRAFDSVALLAGPHRYGAEKALIFVQLNASAPADVGVNTNELLKKL